MPFLLTNLVVAIVSFVVGGLAGTLVWLKFRRSWPPEFDRLAAEIKFLEDELPNVNSAVEELRAKGKHFGNSGRIRVTIITEEKDDVLSKKLRDARALLIGYRKDLEGIVSFLGPLPVGNRPEEARDTNPTPEEKDRDAQLTEDRAVSEYTPLKVDIRIDPKPDQSEGARSEHEIVGLYNRAVTDSLASASFRERYQPLRIGTINAVERRLNPTIEEEFRETTDGDFFAIPIAGQGIHAVVPRLGLTIEAVSLNAGALGKVFGISDFDAREYYSKYSIKKPAIFRKEGERWILKVAGEMDLGPGA